MEKLHSIKTYVLVAWIFALLALLVWIGYFLIAVIIGAIWSRLIGPYFAAVAFVAIVPGTILFLVFAVPTILVFVRLNRMKRAADEGNVGALKGLNSIGWAIVALIFAGIIPGIMLLVAHGPIEELDKASAHMAPDAGVTGDSLDRISKLKSLLDSGTITREEFDSLKNSVLHPGAAQAPQSNPTRPQVVARSTSTTQASGTISSDAALKVEQLKELLDRGLITQQDFGEQKKKILGNIPSSPSIEDELKRLKELYDSGALTAAEYEEQKKRLLQKL